MISSFVRDINFEIEVQTKGLFQMQMCEIISQSDLSFDFVDFKC